MSREEQGKAKVRSMRVQGKVKVRSRQRKHNLNRNYNLMGFDTIETNLVDYKITHKSEIVMKHLFLSSFTSIYVLYNSET